jgi:hypothetical protein
MKKYLFLICISVFMICLSGCKTYVPVPIAPCCQNPYHEHYVAPPMLLWTERVTTDSYTKRVEERFWIPTK